MPKRVLHVKFVGGVCFLPEMQISVCVSLLNFLTDIDLHQYHHYHSLYLPLEEQVPEQFSQEDVIADISALKAFVNKSLKTLSANTR